MKNFGAWIGLGLARMFGLERYLPYYRFLWKVKGAFVAGVLAGLSYALFSGLGMPLMVKVVFPVLFGEDTAQHQWYTDWLLNLLGSVSHEKLLLISCAWIPIIMLMRSVSSYANSYFISYVGMRVLEEIRMEIFGKLQRLPLSFFKNNKSGDLLARLMSDTGALKQIVANVSSDLIKQPGTLIGALVFIVYNSYQSKSFFIALISLLSVPVCVMLIRASGKKLARRARALQKQGGDFTAVLAESLQAPLEIRAYNLEQRQLNTFRSFTERMIHIGMKVVKYRQAISPSIEVVSSVGFAMALYMGVRNGMTMTDFLSLGMALFMSYEPIKKLGLIHSQFKQGDAAIDRIEYISKEPDELDDPEQPKPFAGPRTSIHFDNLTFAYKREPVLKNVMLEIPVGQVVALVGPSGAGKSTFAHLIPRFYDPQEGGIRIDGTDIREFTKKSLREQIAVVPQMPALFMGTIADNIRIGKQGATDEEVIAAARRAHAHDFILTLPNGYQTNVGERGDLLSGGQRQRIAIARAFLKDSPILILDEATSALDSESEAMVQKALTELVKGRTTFIIAHRYSTITIADRVLVFRDGEIVADGTHAELRDTDTTYRSMIGSQLIGSMSAVSS
ncbi:MAG: ABC transporter ATP-binding protein [Luteolibacter sp.]